ncbi:MAG TPA: hypothetical protein VJT72_22020 [Pseudonocardiaceae bacterium]|nr:hypothetical protein [Pseudonocardiaceae bacterium]
MLVDGDFCVLPQTTSNITFQARYSDATGGTGVHVTFAERGLRLPKPALPEESFRARCLGRVQRREEGGIELDPITIFT